MPRNGSGSYSLPQAPFSPNTTISSSAVNSDFSDIASALTQSVSADGQTPITGQMKSNVTATPAWSSSSDATTGFGVSAAGEADIFASGTKIVATTSTGIAVTGNISATGTLGATGSTTLGTATITTGNLTTLNVSGILTDSNTGYWLPPRGNTGARPGSPVTGAQRYNTDNNQIEFWNGSSWQALSGIFTPNFQTFTSGSSATYTTPTGGGNLPLYLRVRMIGGGGGGGAANTNAGSAGNDTSFGSWTAIHGSGGAVSSGTGGAGGAGGSGGTNGTGTVITRVSGATGQGGQGVGGVSPNLSGGAGGSSVFGGAGSGQGSTGGGGAQTNTGSGGAGGATGGNDSGGGGGAGEFAEFVITSPAASYVYTVGSGGAGGSAGGNAGGNGAAGRIEVMAYWQ